MARPPAFSPPERIEEYRLLRSIGRGGMGEVFLGHDVLLDRPVAVKFIAQGRPDEQAQKRFLVEARAIARMTHPNVVTIYRVGTFAGRPYLVSELVRGKSLSHLKKPVPWEQALQIGLGLSRGLARRPPPGRAAPRHQAGQRHLAGRRRGQAPRLRPGQDARRAPLRGPFRRTAARTFDRLRSRVGPRRGHPGRRALRRPGLRGDPIGRRDARARPRPPPVHRVERPHPRRRHPGHAALHGSGGPAAARPPPAAATSTPSASCSTSCAPATRPARRRRATASPPAAARQRNRALPCPPCRRCPASMPASPPWSTAACATIPDSASPPARSCATPWSRSAGPTPWSPKGQAAATPTAACRCSRRSIAASSSGAAPRSAPSSTACGPGPFWWWPATRAWASPRCAGRA